MKTQIPETIYLQWFGEQDPHDEPIDHSAVTWCADKIFDHDLEYRKVAHPPIKIENTQINYSFEDVTGGFDMRTGELVTVARKKHGTVHLCFSGDWNIPFARALLYDSDLAKDADATFKDATRLAEEICRRWNSFREGTENHPENDES